jgi:hypothetical protein
MIFFMANSAFFYSIAIQAETIELDFYWDIWVMSGEEGIYLKKAKK